MSEQIPSSRCKQTVPFIREQVTATYGSQSYTPHATVLGTEAPKPAQHSGNKAELCKDRKSQAFTPCDGNGSQNNANNKTMNAATLHQSKDDTAR